MANTFNLHITEDKIWTIKIVKGKGKGILSFYKVVLLESDYVVPKEVGKEENCSLLF